VIDIIYGVCKYNIFEMYFSVKKYLIYIILHELYNDEQLISTKLDNIFLKNTIYSM